MNDRLDELKNIATNLNSADPLSAILRQALMLIHDELQAQRQANAVSTKRIGGPVV